nr:hypothetical protein [Mycobacterium lepraemurium]
MADAGASVIAVSRSTTTFPRTDRNADVRVVVADAADPPVPGSLVDQYDPQVLVLVAGASPLMRPLQHHTWESFSANWNTDVRIAFHWLREALLKPLRPGSRVVVVSSGAPSRDRRSAAGTRALRPPSLPHRLRPGEVGPRRPGHYVHRLAAAAHPADGPRRARRARVRRSRRRVRAGLRQATSGSRSLLRRREPQSSN